MAHPSPELKIASRRFRDSTKRSSRKAALFASIEKTSRLLKFHAMQALLYGGVWIIVGIAFRILMMIVNIALGDAIGFAAFWGLLLVRILVGLVLLAFLILAAIKAYQGQYYKLPIIGNIAWNIVNK